MGDYVEAHVQPVSEYHTTDPNVFVEDLGEGFVDHRGGPKESYFDNGADRLTRMLEEENNQAPEILVPGSNRNDSTSKRSGHPSNQESQNHNSRTQPPSVKAKSRRQSEKLSNSNVNQPMYPSFQNTDMLVNGSFNKNSGPGEVYLGGQGSRLPDE